MEDEGFVYRQDEKSHQQIWQEYIQRGRTHRAIGFSGKELREFRVEADYFEEIEDVAKSTKLAFTIAEKITHYLEQIEKKIGN